LGDGVGITPVFLVEYQIVAGGVGAQAFLGFDAARSGGPFGPHRRGLHVGAVPHVTVGPGKGVGVDGIRVGVSGLRVADDPIARLAALLPAPLAIDEAVGVEVQLHRHDRLIRSLHVFVPLAHLAPVRSGRA
jgi:hypothetical protein